MAGQQASGNCSVKVPLRFYVSGYNTNKAEPGIYAYDLDTASNTITLVGKSEGVASPSYSFLDGDRMYAASETPTEGGLAAYTLNATGLPEVDAVVDFPHAAGTCFALHHPEGKCLYGADYNSGSISVSKLDDAGNVTAPVTLIQHAGHGSERVKDDPSYDRQLSPHVHTLSFVPGTSLLAAVDLGLDMIVIYRTDEEGNIIDAGAPTIINECPSEFATRTVYTEKPAETTNPAVAIARTMSNGKGGNKAKLPVRPAAVVQAPLFNGPRIVAYHPNKPIVAVICELGCELLLYRYSEDGLHWELLSRHNLLEGAPHINDIQAPPLSAHVQFTNDARFVYTSTRGTNQMIVFSIDDECHLKRIFTCSTYGGTPRHFALSPDNAYLAVANQTGNSVVMYKRDSASGALDKVAEFECPTPSCIVWK